MAQNDAVRNAPAPIFRDPIYDGTADPVMDWNKEEKVSWTLYAAGRASVFYFTHPGRDSHSVTKPEQSFHQNHRTSIQVVPLVFDGKSLMADRDKPFDFYLPDKEIN
ncbi:hypothetical protein [Echinicola salinicaeni]|uniref:hypothetical protein n=1 Tax=Echinicola salinicaeni TaxID=2762757 RepID=UPI001645233B|nr:hypothetical protein [Echinicola salinicaeni]